MNAALVATAAAAFLVAAVFGSAVLATRRWSAGREHVAIAYGLGGVGLVSFVTFIAYWASPRAGVVFSFVVLGAVLVHLGSARVWRYWRQALPLLALTAGILLVYLAMLGFRKVDAGDFYLVRAFASSITGTPDNLLSFLVSDRIATGADTHDFLDNWNGSDRPPLLAGLILLVRGVMAPWMGVQNAGFGASVVGQLIWVPAVYAFARAVGISRGVSFTGVLMVAVTGSTIVNTLYTWPKLMSAALVLAACVLLLDARRRPDNFRRDFIGAVVLFALGMLSHGAAAFALPLVVWLGVLAYRGHRPRIILVTTGLAAVAGLVVYVPWLVYQRIADPPGDRLLKWHLAGVIDEDTRTFTEAFVDSYSALTPGEWLAGRLANLGTVFDLRPLGPGTYSGDVLAVRATAEAYITTAALGLSLVLLLGVLAIVIVRSIQARAVRWEDRRFLFLVAASVACILLWCLLMFIPSSTVVHQGSHVWLFVLTLAPIVWIGTRHPRIAWALVAVQFVATVVLYLPREGALNPLSLIVGVAGLASIALAVRRQRSPSLAN